MTMQQKILSGGPKRLRDGERGASLVIALVFISVFGLILIALGDFATTGAKGTGAFREQRATNYATDAALEAAVNRVAHDANMGVDPSLSPTDACNPATGKTVLTQPAQGDAPKVVVSCSVAAGSGSGKPAELGNAPPYSLLTLGDRRTSQHDGTIATTQGVRNTEPPPYNVPSGDDCQGDTPGGYQESGIRQNKTVMPGRWLFFFPTCGTEPDNYAWNVRGDLFSNSRIQIDTAGAAPQMVTAPDSTTGTIEARGGCSGLVCTDPGWDFSDGKGRDPGLVTPADYALPSLSGLSVQSVPSTSQCSNARKLVTFTPGIYTDAKALNDLFASSACKQATFWFKADDKGTPDDPSDDTTGRYYFDFRNSTTSSQCGTTSWVDFIPDLTQNTTHQWCIAGAADDYGGQHVIGGTPFGWAPTADPTTKLLELIPGKAGAGPGTFFGLFPQPTAFVNGDNCSGSTTAATLTTCGKEIDGKTVDYAFASGKTGSSIWMSNASPKVPRGSYNDTDLQLAYAATNPTRMNAPTIQVNYQTVGFLGLKTTGTCGPYTLPAPTASLTTVKLSAVNPAAYLHLKGCLNTGDKINSAVVQYNVNRPQYQGSPYATAKFDGVKILVTAQDAPSFPRQPSETDPGGDCDPDAAGVQFVFGGDSHVYLPNGGMELCAGPNPSNPLTGQQIAIYGVPATPRLIPSSASGGTNPNNAKIIAEAPTLQYATMSTGQAVTLSYPGFSTPSGYSVSSVAMRASFDASSAATASVRAAGGSEYCNSSFTNALSHTTANPVETKTVDVTACLTASNRLSNAFDVRWTAGSSGSPKLDGIEFIVTLSPNDPNTTLRPQNNCIVASPDYWFGMGQGSSPDCAMVRVDSRFETPIGGIFGGVRQGRMSVKGTIYAPSGVVDIDDTDVWYPIASRGIVARHLRIRGFQYREGFNEPIFNDYVNKAEATRQVVFLACEKDSGACTPTDPSLVGRAAVEFEAGTGKPSVQAWALGKL
jgi:Tfp pilus assembly protein PilX